MARVPQFFGRRETLDTSPQSLPRVRISSAVGEELKGVGRAFGALGNKIQSDIDKRNAENERRENFNTSMRFQLLQKEINSALADQSSNIEGDGRDFSQSFVNTTANEGINSFLESTPERLREEYALRSDVFREDVRGRARVVERGHVTQFENSQLDGFIENIGDRVFNDPTTFDTARSALFDRIDELGRTTAETKELKESKSLELLRFAIDGFIDQGDFDSARELIRDEYQRGVRRSRRSRIERTPEFNRSQIDADNFPESSFFDLPDLFGTGSGFGSAPTIDLSRPLLLNPDGSASTENTVTIQDENGNWVNVPSIVDGVQLENEDEIRQSLLDGKNQVVDGPFDSIEEAVEAAESRSNDIGDIREEDILEARGEAIEGDPTTDTGEEGSAPPRPPLGRDDISDRRGSLPIGAAEFFALDRASREIHSNTGIRPNVEVIPAEPVNRRSDFLQEAPPFVTMPTAVVTTDAENSRPVNVNNLDNVGKAIFQGATGGGIDPMVLLAVAQIESNLRPKAANPRSSARGLFQFIRSTGRSYGLPSNAANASIKDQVAAGVRFTRDNINTFSRAVGRRPTPGEVYLMHFLGAGRGVIVGQNQNSTLRSLFGDDYRAIIRANPFMRSMRTGSDVVRWANRKMAGAMAQFGGVDRSILDQPNLPIIPNETLLVFDTADFGETQNQMVFDSLVENGFSFFHFEDSDRIIIGRSLEPSVSGQVPDFAAEAVADGRVSADNFGTALVADASSSIVPPNTSHGRLMAEIDRREEQIEAGIDEETQRINSETKKDATELLAQGELTPEWVRDRRDMFSATDYDRFLRAATTQEVTSSQESTFQRYLERIHEASDDPSELKRIEDNALDMLANGVISNTTFDHIRRQINSLLPDDSVPTWVRLRRSALSTKLRPSRPGNSEQRLRQIEALEAFDSAIEELMSKDDLSRDQVRRTIRELENEFGEREAQDFRRDLPTSKYFGGVGRYAIDREQLQMAARRLRDNKDNMTREAFRQEAEILRQWRDALDLEDENGQR